ncbi:hypothetical protein QJS66_09330 [Kocuria rhizophila]|nr:hypothetical protein QJS66_09330 [Kocuria rhizophila]
MVAGQDALDAAAEAESLLVALDFDGTLGSVHRRTPEDSRPLPSPDPGCPGTAARTTVAVIWGVL